MTIQEQINQLNFTDIASYYAPVENQDIYFYSLMNSNINVRKTVTNDFETWVVVFNHYDTISIIITGAPPITNNERYTLLQYFENFVKPEPVHPPVAEITEN